MSLKGIRMVGQARHGGRYVLGQDLNQPVAAPVVTFHLLTEGSDTLVTEAGDNLDIEHV